MGEFGLTLNPGGMKIRLKVSKGVPNSQNK
jgi:hypothetical protein